MSDGHNRVVLLARAAILFWERAGEKQDGAAEHQSVSKIVETVADVEWDVDENGQVDNEDYDRIMRPR